jgi:hypothetical protein
MGFDDERPTGRHSNLRPLARLADPHAELSSDPLEAIGQVMAEVGKVGRLVATLNTTVETQARELNAMRRELEEDRSALVRGASKHAAVSSSNRMAALLGTLFVLYTQAAPILRELWRGLMR